MSRAPTARCRARCSPHVRCSPDAVPDAQCNARCPLLSPMPGAVPSARCSTACPLQSRSRARCPLQCPLPSAVPVPRGSAGVRGSAGARGRASVRGSAPRPAQSRGSARCPRPCRSRAPRPPLGGAAALSRSAKLQLAPATPRLLPERLGRGRGPDLRRRRGKRRGRRSFGAVRSSPAAVGSFRGGFGPFRRRSGPFPGSRRAGRQKRAGAERRRMGLAERCDGTGGGGDWGGGPGIGTRLRARRAGGLAPGPVVSTAPQAEAPRGPGLAAPRRALRTGPLPPSRGRQRGWRRPLPGGASAGSALGPGHPQAGPVPPRPGVPGLALSPPCAGPCPPTPSGCPRLQPCQQHGGLCALPLHWCHCRDAPLGRVPAVLDTLAGWQSRNKAACQGCTAPAWAERLVLPRFCPSRAQAAAAWPRDAPRLPGCAGVRALLSLDSAAPKPWPWDGGQPTPFQRGLCSVSLPMCP